jgi:hypothetical protein
MAASFTDYTTSVEPNQFCGFAAIVGPRACALSALHLTFGVPGASARSEGSHK